MALVAPFLIALLYAAFELGWAMQCGSSVREAVQHSSRALISNSELTNEQLTNKVNDRLDHLPITNLTVSITEEWVAGNAQVARVTWDYDYTLTMPWVPSTLFHFGSNIVVPRAQA